MSNSSHIKHIESLRAFAAFSVVLFHFICFNNGICDIYSNEIIKSIATYGAQGVEMFYIISGFVITYALTRANYKIVHYGKYLLKRIIRIIPVYFMAIVAIYCIQFIWNSNFQLNISNILANLTFTVDLWEGAMWINPIFSTLGVEFQFYLLIGLLLPLFQYKIWIKYLCLIIMLVIGITTIEYQSVFVNAPYFVTGIVLHDIYRKKNLQLSYGLIGGILLLLFSFYYLEDLITVIFMLTLMLWIKPSFKFSNAIGAISYSLYLTHGVFGGWLLYFLSRDEYIKLSPYLSIPLAIVFSLIGAKVFYLLFEKPSIRLGKRIRFYKK